MYTLLSTGSGDERCPQKADTARKGSSSHQDLYIVQAGNHASCVRTRSISKLSAAQLSRKRKNDREAQRATRQRTKAQIEGLEQRTRELEQRNRELEDELGLLKVRMAAKNAADNNNVGFGMPMHPSQNMGADTASMKWPIDIDNNMTGMVSAFGNETSMGDVYNVGEEGRYEDSAFGHHITQHPWARLNVSSTTDLNNGFYGELP
ncbi:hypothetical protein VF21_02104 [Pseudogymnoascus sp. 05NY08]|nr:hypothetical protein VF21_01968 [Pseudogymnoascus sp. 05NY08]OBT79447.1 hypothetical protein VF21_02104 [Pseudogymnoascus sp. 05NY08]